MPAPKDPQKRQEWLERLKTRPKHEPWNKGKTIKNDPEYDEYRSKLSDSNRGRQRTPLSEESKQKISNSLKGKMKGKRIGFANGGKHTEETKRKMSESHRGKTHGPMSEEQKAKVSDGMKRYYAEHPEQANMLAEINRNRSPEAKAKFVASLKAYYQSEAGIIARQRMSELLTERQLGSTLSEEHKAAISEANKRYFNQPHIKQELSERSKAMWADPIARDKLMTALFSDNVNAARAEASRLRWTDDEFKQYMSQILSERMQHRWDDPEARAVLLEVNADPDVRAKKSKSHKELWQNSEHRERMLPISMSRIADTKKFITGYHDSPKAGSVRYRSSYELEVYKQLDVIDDVMTYEAEPFFIPYEFEGVIHSYFPDLLITYIDYEQLLVEVKPSYQLDDPQNQAKFLAAQAIYGDRFEVWSEEVIFNID